MDSDTAVHLAERPPRDDEIDFFGLTHLGKTRTVNQDHYLICSIRKKLEVHLTSLPAVVQLPSAEERVAMVAMVADGVGGGPMGEVASRFAVEAVTEYVTRSIRCWSRSDDAANEVFAHTLWDAAREVHESLVREAARDPALENMATTLTMWIGMWPRSFLLQVGDSRCYILRDGALTQLSRDQTMAQELIDIGVLTQTDAHRSKWMNMLSSSIGGPQSTPVVSTLSQEWGAVGLLCSDGLTKHVSDDQIRQRLSTMTSAKQVCEALLQDALDDGGTDNITIVVGRTIRNDP